MTHKTLRQVIYFYEMTKKIEGKGDGVFVECGIGYGGTFLILAMLAKDLGKDIWGFDSFQGFPEPTTEDTSPRNPKKGEWNVVTKGQIMETLKRRGCGFAKLVSGFFDSTLRVTDTGPIALLHLDVDLYQSYRTCLEELYPRMIKGGIILFDEYEDENFPGGKKAIDEFCKKKNLFVQSYMGKHYCIVQ